MRKDTAQTLLAEPEAVIMISQGQPINHQIITYKLLRAISESLEPESVAYLAAEKVSELTGWPSVAILSPNQEGALVVRTAIGPILTDVGISGRAFRTGDTQIVDDLIGESDVGPTYQKEYSALSIPINRSRRKLGVFNVEKDDPFSQDDVLLAESMAEVIGLALDHAELYAQAQRRLAALTALQEAASAISSTLNLAAVLTHIAEQMGQAIGVTSCYICRYDKQAQTATVTAEYISAFASEKEKVSDLGVTYYLPDDFPNDLDFLQSGEMSVRYVDDFSLSEVMRQHLEEFGGQTVLSIPLQIGGETIAYAELWDSRHHRHFTQEELTLCQGIAQHAAVAMENARLFQEIRQEHGRFQALINADDDGIFLVGSDGRFLVINKPGHTFLGLPGQPQDWIGHMVRETLTAISQVAAPAAEKIHDELIRVENGDEEIAEGEFEIPPRILHWRNLPVMSGQTLIGRLVVLRDITRERNLEKMRDDLMHTMVHDLRGPLTSISISMDILKMLENDPQAASSHRVNAITRASASTQQLLGLVESILEISQLESGHLHIQQQPVDMSEMVRAVLDMQSPVAADKAITVSCEIDRNLPAGLADRSLVERVLQNLIHNAIKFTPESGQICVQATLFQDEAERLLISVTDTGQGVPVNLRENLFQKFSRGSQKERGSGLGLYFCKMVVEAHHGRIWLNHTDETGTTIQFTLPLAAALPGH